MRIAFFNWRDVRHPQAGGAEGYVHQIMKQAAATGHRVALFTSSFPGSSGHEVIDGIEHFRYAGKYLLYPKSYLCYKKHVEGRFDVIVESINGMPFFTPLFAKEPVVALVHQLTRENWYSGLPLPFAFIGYHLEDALLSPYSRRQAIAPSESTRSDLARLGFSRVAIVHAGADNMIPPPGAKRADSGAKTVAYLGRLTRSKRVDQALLAFKAASARVPGLRMLIAGSGPEEKRLKSLAVSLGLGGKAEFLGRVSEERKVRLLCEADLLLFPAVREGWGLVVFEANSCGTPVIGYRVPGLTDSVRDGVNGYLVASGDAPAMGAKAAEVLSDGKELARLSASAKAHAGKFRWADSAERFLRILSEAG